MRFVEICAAFINNNMATLYLKTLDKDELELLGRKFGTELDKRKTKGTLVKTLTKYIDSLTKDDLEAAGREIGIELDKRHDIDDLIEELAAYDPNCGCDDECPCEEEEVVEEQSEGETVEEEALRRGETVRFVQNERNAKSRGLI
jgi:hypothetical protein|tara:strand:+ start:259 stop:693 length:435 start_codon:yes stop_codon:yes gene_type:complete